MKSDCHQQTRAFDIMFFSEMNHIITIQPSSIDCSSDDQFAFVLVRYKNFNKPKISTLSKLEQSHANNGILFD